jgi:thiamine transport system substrate-binding protein
MYPARMPASGLPKSFATLEVPKKSLTTDPGTLAANRRAWIDEWLAAMAR